MITIFIAAAVGFLLFISIVFFVVVSWLRFKQRYSKEVNININRFSGFIHSAEQGVQEQLEFEAAVSEMNGLIERAEKSKAAFQDVNLDAPSQPTTPDQVLKFLEGMGPVMIVGAEMFAREFIDEMHPASLADAAEKLKELGVQYVDLRHHGIQAAKDAYEFTLEKFHELVGNHSESIGDLLNHFSGANVIDLAGNFSDTGHFFLVTDSVSGGLLEASAHEFAHSIFSGIVDFVPVTTIVFGILREYKIQKSTNKELLKSVEDVIRDTGYTFAGGVAGHLVGVAADAILPGSQAVLVILFTAAGSILGRTKAREKRLQKARDLEIKFRKNVELMESEFQELNLEIHKVWQRSSEEATKKFHVLLGEKATPAMDKSTIMTIAQRLQLLALRDVESAHKYIKDVEQDIFHRAARKNPLPYLMKILNLTPTNSELERAVLSAQREVEAMKQEIPTTEMIQEYPEHALGIFAKIPVFIHGVLVPEFNVIRRNVLGKVNSDFSRTINTWETHATLSLNDALLHVAASLKPYLENVEKAKSKWGAEIKKLGGELRQAFKEANVKEGNLDKVLQQIDIMLGGTVNP